MQTQRTDTQKKDETCTGPVFLYIQSALLCGLDHATLPDASEGSRDSSREEVLLLSSSGTEWQ